MSETTNNKPKMNMPRFNLSWLYMFIAMTIAYLYFTSDDSTSIDRQLTYTEFKNMVNKGYASKIIAYNDNTVDMFVKPEYVKEVFKDDYKKVGRSPSMHVEIGSMDATLAAKIMYDGQGADVIKEKAAEYAALQTSATGAAKRGYVDQIIEPTDTRKYVIGAFEMLMMKREDRPYKKHGTV